ncbi:MAG: flagellar motor protein MotB [Betaproteobacteria bacterium]|nr:flagellar motor protein MotB [Betaproteobacteria bacterium]
MPNESQLADTDDNMREMQFWLPAYAALCLVLLTFFAMLCSMSVLDPQRFEHSMSSIRKALGGDTGSAPSQEEHSPEESSQAHRQLATMQTRIFNDIRTFIAQNATEAGIETVQEEDSIILRLPEDHLFIPGTDHILPTGRNTLHQLENFFILHDQQKINIRGYTDDTPLPPGTRFRDNWELSALQATQVLRHLLTQGIEPGRLTATGFGELEPLFPNTTEKNREKNRRIEFVLERQPGKE